MPDNVSSGWQSHDVAENYDDRRFSSISGRLSHLLDTVALRSALRSVRPLGAALDMPCGTGRMTQILARYGFARVVAADVSPAMLKIAADKEALRLIEFVPTDAMQTTFADGEFNVIASIRFIGHLDDDQLLAVLREMRRICSGYAIIESPRTDRVALWIKSSLLRRATVKARLDRRFSWYERSNEHLAAITRDGGWQVIRTVRKLPGLSESVFVVLKAVDAQS